MADQLTQKQILKFKVMFTSTDSDADGSICTGELGHLMRSLGHNPTEAKLQEVVDKVDTDGNGVIEFSEGDEIRQMAFRFLDVDRNGFISPSDLRQRMERLGETVTDDNVDYSIIREGDTDGDGQVSYKEYVQMMKKRAV